MKRMKYVESNVPDHLRVWVTYHRPERRRDRWCTEAKLIDTSTEEAVATAYSKCSRLDNPNKKIGRAIAVGRAFKKYMQRGE